MKTKNISTCTTEDIAYALSCSVQNVGQMIRDKKLPKPINKNCHNTKDAFRHAIDLEREKNSQGKNNIDAQNLRLTTAKADKAELESEQLRESLIKIEDAKRTWENLVATFRSKMMILPRKNAQYLAQITIPTEIEKLLKEQINDALTELSNYDPYKTTNKHKTGDKASCENSSASA